MNKFSFTIDKEVEEFCCEIVEIMVHNFGISYDEAIERINRNWNDRDIDKIDDLGHHWPQYWACIIYYEPHEKWWIQGEERGNLGLPMPKSKSLT